jgi:hypothetical protein
MRLFEITVRAVVTKVMYIEADDEETASGIAMEDFSVLNEDGVEERYDQEVVNIEEMQ